jgi:hypothetical protein
MHCKVINEQDVIFVNRNCYFQIIPYCCYKEWFGIPIKSDFGKRCSRRDTRWSILSSSFKVKFFTQDFNGIHFSRKKRSLEFSLKKKSEQVVSKKSMILK